MAKNQINPNEDASIDEIVRFIASPGDFIGDSSMSAPAKAPNKNREPIQPSVPTPQEQRQFNQILKLTKTKTRYGTKPEILIVVAPRLNGRKMGKPSAIVWSEAYGLENAVPEINKEIDRLIKANTMIPRQNGRVVSFAGLDNAINAYNTIKMALYKLRYSVLFSSTAPMEKNVHNPSAKITKKEKAQDDGTNS